MAVLPISASYFTKGEEKKVKWGCIVDAVVVMIRSPLPVESDRTFDTFLKTSLY